MRKSNDYEEQLRKALKDPQEALEYLNAALEEGDKDTFLLALKDVAAARGNMSKLARQAKLDRVSLYRIFSGKGNPEIRSLESILEALGLGLAVVQRKAPKLQRAA
jgi:probable addiction module antidote protein